MRIRVAADVDQKRRVIDNGALLTVEPNRLGKPQRDQALTEHMLHRLSKAEIDPEGQRSNELRHPDVDAIGLSCDRTCHSATICRSRG